MKKSISVIAAFLFFALGIAGAQATEENYRGDINDVFINCNNDEPVFFTGRIHILVKRSSGAHDEYYHVNIQGQGFGGNSGATYVVNYNENFMPTDSHGTWTGSLNVIGRGSVPDFRAGIVAHYTENANGEPVVDFISTASNCE